MVWRVIFHGVQDQYNTAEIGYTHDFERELNLLLCPHRLRTQPSFATVQNG